MYIGLVTYKKDIVESLLIEAKNADEAVEKLADYVYKNYNKNNEGEFYSGLVIETKKLKKI